MSATSLQAVALLIFCFSFKLLLLGRGMKGVAFTDAPDKREVCPTLPEYGTPEYDSTSLNRLHASIPALLSSAAAEQLQEGAQLVHEAQPVRYTIGHYDTIQRV